MVFNFLYAYRNFIKNRNFGILNVLTLSLGITIFSICIFIINQETSFDTYHKNFERIFRIGSSFKIQDRIEEFAYSSSYLYPFLNDYTDIKTVCRFKPIGYAGVSTNYRIEQLFFEDFFLVDSSLTDLYKLQFTEGSKSNALNEINSIIISNNVASMLFPNKSRVIGETIKLDDLTLKVTGIFKDLPKNTHLRFSAAVSYSTLKNKKQDISNEVGLWNVDVYTYVKMKEGSSREKLNYLLDRISKDKMSQFGNVLKAEFNPVVERIDNIHFNSSLPFDLPRGNRLYIYTLSLVSILLIIIVVINYNIVFVRKILNRSKELNIKRVYGSGMFNLIVQFTFEILLDLIPSITIVFFVLIYLKPKIEKPYLDFYSQDYLIPLGYYNVGFIIAILIGMLVCLISFLVISSMSSGFQIGGMPSKTLRAINRYSFSFQLILSIFLLSYFSIIMLNRLRLNIDRIVANSSKIFVVEILNSQLNNNSINLLSDYFDSFPIIQNYSFADSEICSSSGAAKLMIEVDNPFQEKKRTIASVIKSDTSIFRTLPFNLTFGKPVIGTGVVINSQLSNIFEGGGRYGLMGRRKHHVENIIENTFFEKVALLNRPTIFFFDLMSAKYIYLNSPNLDTEGVHKFLDIAFDEIGRNEKVVYHINTLRENILYENNPFNNSNMLLILMIVVMSLVVSVMGVFNSIDYTFQREEKNLAIMVILGASLRNLVSKIFKSFYIPVIILFGLYILVAVLLWVYKSTIIDIDYKYLFFFSTFYLFILILIITIYLFIKVKDLASLSISKYIQEE